MHLRTSRRSGRQGFTLIEILIVIAIIGVLTGMISSAAARVFGWGRKTRLAMEIRDLATAVENFKERYGFYPPSRFILCELPQDYFYTDANGNNVARSKLHQDSFTMLSRMFPRCAWVTKLGPSPMSPSWIGIDWNGDNKPSPSVLLEGDQCLVFFLGGLPSNSGRATCTGFSTNPRDPAAHLHGLSSETTAPFYEFDSGRLTTAVSRSALLWNPALPVLGGTPTWPGLVGTAVTTPSPTPDHRFYSYLDPYGAAPYAYLSSFKSSNGYNPYFGLILTQFSPSTKLFTSDCASLHVWPYAERVLSPGLAQYMNPNSFQIISAGVNGSFGRGSDLFNSYPSFVPPALWSSSVAGNMDQSSASWNMVPQQEAGLDDMSNFYKLELGISGAD